jgi:hypothetical protein
MSVLDFALDAAARGFRVLPLLPNSKKPFITEWQYAATTDIDKITKWFKGTKCNYGNSLQDYAVVDIDPRNGGTDTWNALVSELGLGPADGSRGLAPEYQTLVASTAGGGWHLYYKLPPGRRFKSGADVFGKGVDLKTGSSSQVVGPGSTIDGKEYTWLRDIEPIELPPQLVEIAERAGKPSEKNAGDVKQLADELDPDWAIEVVEAYLRAQPEVPGGTRNNTAYKTAASVFDWPISDALGLELMTEWNETKCSPRLDADELAAAVASGAVNRENHRGIIGTSNGFEPTQIAEPDDGPAKAESKGGGPDWDEPADLWADAADPPDLAVGVLPPALERWVNDEAERKGVDLGVMAVPAVVVCAAAIPAQFQLQVKQADTGHKTRGMLWGAIVGDPGVRKSPVLAAAKAPIEAAEAEWKRRNQILDEEYKKNWAAWKHSVKEGGEEPEPVPPKRLRKIVMDATTEALGLILNDNPAGLLAYNDELSMWIGSMDAYRSNKSVSRDQGFWLAAKEGNSSVVDRAGRGTLVVDITAIHILGGVQPSVIRKVVSEWGGNGLMQRFYLSWLRVPARVSTARRTGKPTRPYRQPFAP